MSIKIKLYGKIRAGNLIGFSLFPTLIEYLLSNKIT